MRSHGSLSLACAFAFLLSTACTAGEAGPEPEVAADLMSLEVPAEHADGEVLFEAHCMECHGRKALGTERGPPLVHRVYEPNHHADITFHMAVRSGVRAHHWGFGDMPPVPGMRTEEVDEIVGYIRWLQRQAEIY